EFILEKVLAIKYGIGSDGSKMPMLLPNDFPYPSSATGSAAGPSSSAAAMMERANTNRESMVLCKWLGKNMTQVTWEPRAHFKSGTREDRLVKKYERERGQREMEI